MTPSRSVALEKTECSFNFESDFTFSGCGQPNSVCVILFSMWLSFCNVYILLLCFKRYLWRTERGMRGIHAAKVIGVGTRFPAFAMVFKGNFFLCGKRSVNIETKAIAKRRPYRKTQSFKESHS